MAEQLIVDLYGCDTSVLDDLPKIREIVCMAVESIGASIVEECSHAFKPVGISYVAVITTSHLSVHTWPEYGYAAIDVFSCASHVPEHMVDALYAALGAHDKRVMRVDRVVGNTREADGPESQT